MQTWLSELADHRGGQWSGPDLTFYGMGSGEPKGRLWIHKLCNKEGCSHCHLPLKAAPKLPGIRYAN